jgi:hypothetical protein
VENLFPPQFESYAEAIAGLPERKRLFKTDLLVQHFQLFKSERLEIYYAPFDFVNIKAKVVIVGITPGWTQMEIAFRQAGSVLRDGGTSTEAAQKAKSEASFAGAMRNNLVKMLNEIGLQTALGLKSCVELFENSNHLVHTTSVVRHPVFINGRNYTGHSPDLLSHPVMIRYVEFAFAPELTVLPQTLVVPLGKCVDAVLRRFIQSHGLNARRCLLGFPHPSPANGHRRKQFEQRRDGFIRSVEEWASAAGD